MAKHDFDPYHKWLGIPKKQRPPTYYDLLGISLDEEDAEVIRGAAEQRRRFVESKRGDGYEAAVGEVLYQIDEAELTLLNSEMRRDYDRRLNLFHKRRRSRQVDPNATRPRIESRPGRAVGEESGIVRTFFGVMAVLMVGFGVMAWFGFQLPWSKPTQRTPERVAVAAEPEATESTPKETTRDAVVDDVASTEEQVEETSTALANTTSEAINEATLPVPVLYLPCDPSVATVPSNVAFTRKGGRYAAGKIGQAVSFDGTSYTELEASLPLGNAPRTMAFWVRNDRGPVKHIVQVVTQTVRWEKAKAFGIIEAGGNWRFHDMNGGLDSGIKIDRGWHHLAVTCDGKTIRYFFDGKRVAEADRNLETESRRLRIGGLGSPDNNFVGLIDELYVFDVPLTEDQIRRLMNGTASSSATREDGERTDNVSSIAHRISSRTFPSVFQAWGEAENLDGEDKWSTVSRHDLVFHSPEFFGLRRNESHPGLATSFTEDSVTTALGRRAQLLEKNPQLVMLAELRYRDAHSSFLPANHGWWRRKDGKLVMGWAEGGYIQLDFSRPDFRTHVAQQAKAIMDTKVVDGIMLDWWADDNDRLELVKTIRRAIGDKPLILVNANDRRTPRTAPFVNGYFMECYRSRTPEDWRRIAETLQWAERNLKVPRINCVETWYHESRKDLQLMRATTTLAMTLSDGYCLFSDPNSLPTPDHRHDWYEFWDQNLGRSKTAGVVQPDGHVVREFTGGTAVYNPLGNKPVTVQLATAHRQASTGRSGTRFVVPAGDGDIFLREVAEGSEDTRRNLTNLRADTSAVQSQDVSATTGDNRLLNRAVHPDQSICVISTTPLRFLVANPPGTVLMEGRSFEDSRIVRTVLSPSRKAGEYDEQYAGIGGAVRIGKTIIAVFHAEKPTGGQTEFGAPRFYATIGLAISEDNGNSFRKIGPIISGLPENPSWKGAAQGNGDPTLCIDHTGEWLYCFYTEHSRRNPATGEKRSVITCMARSRVSDRGMPGTWHKLYKGAFSEPGLGGKDTEVANVWAPHVQYVKGLKKYVMVGNRGGIRLFHSDDGIQWSRPTDLYRVADLPYGEFAWHPSFFIERERGDKANGILFYGYSPDGKVPPYMYGRTMAITTSGDGVDDDGEGLKKKLAGTKWVNSNNVTFEWTKDGRVLHSGEEREWKVLDGSRVQIVFGPGHVDTLEFDSDMTTFKQLIKGGPTSFTGRRQ